MRSTGRSCFPVHHSCPSSVSPKRIRPVVDVGLVKPGWTLRQAALAIAGRMPSDLAARLPEEVSHGPSHLGISLRIPRHFVSPEAGLTRFCQWPDDNRRLLETFSPSTFRPSEVQSTTGDVSGLA